MLERGEGRSATKLNNSTDLPPAEQPLCYSSLQPFEWQ